MPTVPGLSDEHRAHLGGEVTNELSSEYDSDEPTVCPVHLRFVPCRRCKRGEEVYSTDPVDVAMTKRCQKWRSI